MAYWKLWILNLDIPLRSRSFKYQSRPPILRAKFSLVFYLYLYSIFISCCLAAAVHSLLLPNCENSYSVRLIWSIFIFQSYCQMTVEYLSLFSDDIWIFQFICVFNSDSSILHRATQDVSSAFPSSCVSNFAAEFVFIATWDNVTFYGGSSTTPVCIHSIAMNCMAPWIAWHHGLHGTMNCMAPWNAWHHELHGNMNCMVVPWIEWHHELHGTMNWMVPWIAWYHELNCTMNCMTPWIAWHHELHGTMNCMVAPWIEWHHELHGTMNWMVPWIAWYHELNCTMNCMTPWIAWHHELHNTMNYYMAPWIAWHASTLWQTM